MSLRCKNTTNEPNWVFVVVVEELLRRRWTMKPFRAWLAATQRLLSVQIARASRTTTVITWRCHQPTLSRCFPVPEAHTTLKWRRKCVNIKLLRRDSAADWIRCKKKSGSSNVSSRRVGKKMETGNLSRATNRQTVSVDISISARVPIDCISFIVFIFFCFTHCSGAKPVKQNVFIILKNSWVGVQTGHSLRGMWIIICIRANVPCARRVTCQRRIEVNKLQKLKWVGLLYRNRAVNSNNLFSSSSIALSSHPLNCQFAHESYGDLCCAHEKVYRYGVPLTAMAGCYYVFYHFAVWRLIVCLLFVVGCDVSDRVNFFLDRIRSPTGLGGDISWQARILHASHK